MYKTALKYLRIVFDLRYENVTLTSVFIVKFIEKYIFENFSQ